MKDSKTKKNIVDSSLGNPDVTEGKKKFFIDTIAKFCDKCGSPYTTNDVHIVQESNFSSIIHFSCSNCKSNQIATFIRPIGMTSRVPINSDLGVNEISEYASYEKINSDEVLDLFSYLEASNDHIVV